MSSYSNQRGTLLSSAQYTMILLIANIGIFLVDMYLKGQLIQYLALWSLDSPKFSFYQILTHMFAHGGSAHIFFNMFGLYMFGRQLELELRSKKFLILYFVSGLGAAGLQLLVYYLQGTTEEMVGASGAVMGIVAAFATLHPNAELMIIPIPIPIKAKYLIPGYMVLSLFLGMANFEMDNIAHFAHLGGAIIGFILALFWKKDQYRVY